MGSWLVRDQSARLRPSCTSRGVHWQFCPELDSSDSPIVVRYAYAVDIFQGTHNVDIFQDIAHLHFRRNGHLEDERPRLALAFARGVASKKTFWGQRRPTRTRGHA